ncbi:sulfur carrier protein ThiS [Desulforamulus aquiferis]|uniref:Sulfur carrier protein ThiS n=1 Tax=Desulforamulus aquiferis TaxID=1397668 RepID=A0AAW7ZFH6_9FIRM|nr:sulfur carrier protein ThiS [Desulforamulus aquiferis]MDO7788096.1 sulfur carrier protein ThiS [Desulforamulus aquiferis]
MNIVLNGKELILAEGMSIENLIEQRGLRPDTIIVEHNLQVVKRERWSSILLKENDQLEILRFVGGG